MRTYEQLSREERYQIQASLRMQQSVPQIARALRRAPSTIYREIARNADALCPSDMSRWPHPPPAQKYNPERAHNRAAKRRVVKGAAQRKIRGELQELVESKLRLSWSPEQICGRLWAEKGVRLSAETIYQHILRDTKRLGFYRYCLRYGGYKHHRFKKSTHAERTRERKRWISSRPQAANDRREVGHWERDLLLGKRGGSALLVLEDRKSRYVILRHVESCDEKTVSAATIAALRNLPVKTITNDNGREFTRDQSLEHKLGCKVYFCNPYSPQERGSIENTNGLIRQYLPKGFDMDDLRPADIAAVEETINHRPRKVLGWRTTHEDITQTDTQLMENDTVHFGLEFSLRS